MEKGARNNAVKKEAKLFTASVRKSLFAVALSKKRIIDCFGLFRKYFGGLHPLA